jgi:triosephosphate isomerase
MRRNFVAGNWKMNKTIAEAKALVEALLPEVKAFDNVDKAVCPPYLAIPAVVASCQGMDLHVGAQNVYWEESGAYTGEVSPQMVAEVCAYVIIGHSERRALFG